MNFTRWVTRQEGKTARCQSSLWRAWERGSPRTAGKKTCKTHKREIIGVARWKQTERKKDKRGQVGSARAMSSPEIGPAQRASGCKGQVIAIWTQGLEGSWVICQTWQLYLILSLSSESLLNIKGRKLKSCRNILNIKAIQTTLSTRDHSHKHFKKVV